MLANEIQLGNTITESCAAQGGGPKSVYLSSLSLYSWLDKALIPMMRERFGTRFFVVTSASSAEDYRNLVEGDGSVQTLEELELAMHRGFQDSKTVYDEATDNEQKYSLRYLRDILQQDRAIFGSYMAYASNVRRGRDPESLQVLIKKINDAFAFYDTLFSRETIDLVIARPGGIFDTSVLHYAMATNVPVTLPRLARSRQFVTWSYGPYSNSHLIRQVYQTVPEKEPTDINTLEAPDSARRTFDVFRRRYAPAAVAKEATVMLLTHLVNRSQALLKRQRSGMNPFLVDMQGIAYSWRCFQRVEGMSEGNLDSIVKKAFVYFPLSKEPEYTVQSLSRQFSNLQTMVEQVALALPASMTLVIKEHSRLGDRRIQFYRDLLRLPNVVMASPRIPGLSLVARAAGVCTVAGTAALEAAQLGKRALVFAPNVEYDVLSSIQTVGSFETLPMKIGRLVEPLDEEQRLAIRKDAARFMASYEALSFDAAGTRPFGGTSDLAPDQADRAMEILLHLIAEQQKAYGSGIRPD